MENGDSTNGQGKREKKREERKEMPRSNEPKKIKPSFATPQQIQAPCGPVFNAIDCARIHLALLNPGDDKKGTLAFFFLSYSSLAFGSLPLLD